MITGAIKFFNAAKKFGFVTPDDGGKDIYLPATAAAAADVARLKPGQRVSFERESDPRGEKAANLKLLAEAPQPAPVMRQAPAPVVRQSLTIYLDPATPEAESVEDAVRARNLSPVVVDYAAAPLTAEQLKHLALLVGANDQSLVRRYHSVFLGLQLDDRFISEGEYWTAIAEHPALVNGPVILAHGRAGICKSKKDVAAFLDHDPAAAMEKKPKQISARLAAMINGQPVLPLDKALPAAAKVTTSPVEIVVKLKSPAKPPAPTTRKAAPAPKAAPKKPEKKAVKKTAKPAAKPAKKTKPPLKAKKKK